MGSTRLTVDVPDHGWQENVSPDSIGELLGDSRAVLWLDIRDPETADLELLRRQFGFHELTLEDVANIRLHQRPTCDTYRGYHFVIVYAVEHLADEFVPRKVQLFWGANYLVTIHEGEIAALDRARTRWERQDSRQEHGVGYLAYTMFDSLVDGYLLVQDSIGERVEEIEEAVLKGADGAAADLFRMRKQLMSLRRLLAPTGDVLTQVVRRQQARLPESLNPYFADIKDHLVNVLDELDSYRDLLAAALDIHSESMFARLGLIVQRLTAITVIIMVPNLVASIYGMNFETFFPPHDWDYGFVFVVGLIVVMIVWGFIHSRLLRWL